MIGVAIRRPSVQGYKQLRRSERVDIRFLLFLSTDSIMAGFRDLDDLFVQYSRDA
jgi:hypothetical protein